MFSSTAQLSIVPPPAIEKQIYIQDVSNVLIINHHRTSIQGYIVISITKFGTNENITITSGTYSFISGSTKLNINNHIKSVNTGSNQFAGFTQSIKGLPYGNYHICYSVIGIAENEIFAEECDHFRSMPLIPVTNESPHDNEKVKECGFILTWSPPVPIQDNITYNLKVIENNDLFNKGSLHNISNSNPVVLRNGLRTNSYFVNSNLGLSGGKNYAWQVYAIKDGQIISESKPSLFTYLCEMESQDQVIENTGTFWKISNKIGNSHYFLTENVLRLKYDHFTSDEKVSCEIRKVDVSPSIQIFNGFFEVKYGINLIEQPLESMEKGIYQAVIRNYSGHRYVLEYIIPE